jgi:hypothetical protein
MSENHENLVAAALANLDQQEKLGDFAPGELDKLIARERGEWNFRRLFNR